MRDSPPAGLDLAAAIREPLLHFAVLGFGLFLLWGVLHRGDGDIVVRAATVQRLERDAERQLGRPPSEGELQEVIDGWVDDELLYREGLKLGLDRADPVVRRRIIQKMRFLQEDLRPVPEPGDGDLAGLASDLPPIPPRLSFEQITFHAGPTGEGTEARRTDALAQLALGADPATLGDPLALGRRFTGRALPTVARDLGEDFAAAALGAPLNTWVRASSPYGLHLLRVTERSAARPPTEGERRPALVAAWKRQRRQDNARVALGALRAGASIRVER